MVGKIALARTIALNFWGWWTTELTLLFSLMKPSSQYSLRRVLFIGQESWTVIDELGAQKEEVAHIDIKNLNKEIEILTRQCKSPRFSGIDIRLSNQLGLRRLIDLPLAAKADLAELLYYEIDRLTPFNADDIYFSWRVIETDKARQQIKVELVTIPRNTIDCALSIAKVHRLSIARIEVEGAEEHDFLHRVQAIAKRSLLQIGLPYIAALACLVLLAVASLTILRQQKDIEHLANEVTSARSQADEHSAARKQYEQLAETVRLVESRKEGTPTMTEILAELTQLIPDQAYLIQLVIHHDTIQLYGFAERASALITLLEQSPIFAAPRFDSPVTMNSDTGREQFHLTVQTVMSLN